VMNFNCGAWIVFSFIAMMLGLRCGSVSYSDSISIVLLTTIATMIHIHVFKDSKKETK
jgi:hypothetical protein